MRLLLLNHNLREHGTYFRAFHFGRELVAMGHEVTLLTASPGHWYRSARENCDGVEVIETPSWNPVLPRDDGFGPLDSLYRMGVVLRRRWDALYAFAHPPNVLLPHWVYRLVRRGPVSVDWCDLYGGREGVLHLRERSWTEIPERKPTTALRRAIHRLSWGVERRAEQHMVRRAPRLTVISRFLQQKALRLGVPRSRILRLPSGAPTDSIRPLPKEDCRANLGLPVGEERVIGVYVANYHHDERFFLASLRQALREGRGTKGFVLYVIGPPFTPEWVREFELSEVVREMGRRPFTELPRWLGAADVLLLPYPDTVFNRSRWPNKIGDYLAAGRPTLTNGTGDFRPLFERFDIGVASEGTPEAYGRSIAEAIRSRERWGAWGREARRVAEGPLSWSRLARRLADFWLEESADLE